MAAQGLGPRSGQLGGRARGPGSSLSSRGAAAASTDTAATAAGSTDTAATTAASTATMPSTAVSGLQPFHAGCA